MGGGARAAAWAAAACACMAGGAGAALRLGQDANWDLKNYHLYNAWSLLEGRLAFDHHPAGEQTFINPLLDLLAWPLLTAMPDRWGGALLGAVQGLGAFAVLVLAWLLFGATRRAIPVAAISAAAGATSAVAIAEYGTTFGDLTTAPLVIGSLCLAVAALRRPPAPGADWRLAGAGLLMGAATGLKLTNGIFGLGLLAAAAAFPVGARLRSLGWVAGPAAAGLAGLQGWWSWILLRETGSPLFPFANGVFRSPLYPDANFKALGYFPESFLEVLLFPFHYPFSHRTAEVAFRDFRLAAAMVAAVLLAAALLGLRRRGKAPPPGAPDPRAAGFLLVFGCVSYLSWLLAFSIQRYVVALEMIAPLACFAAIGFVARPLARDALALATGAALVATTAPADWGRVPWDGHPHTAMWNFDPAARGAAVIIVTRPLAFVAADSGLRETLWAGTPFTRADRQRLLARIGERPVKVLALGGEHATGAARAAMRRLGLAVDGPCSHAWAKLVGPVLLCPAAWRGTPGSLAGLANDSSRWAFEIEPLADSLRLAPGGSAWLAVRVRNVSPVPAWANLPDTFRLAGMDLPPAAAGEVNLSYHLLGPAGEVVLQDGVRTRLPRSLAPGESFVAHVRVGAPAAPGRYGVQVDLVREGVEWMGARAKGRVVPLEVAGAP